MRRWLGTVLIAAALAACASPGGTTRKTVQAAPVPAGYVGLAQSDLTDEKNVNIVIDFDAPLEEGEQRLQILFPIMYMGAVSHPPTNLGLDGASGTGLGVDSPLAFPALAADLELDAIGAYLARHFPGHDDDIGSLFRAPDKSYLVLAEFETGAGSNALYFDVTRWVEARKAKAY
jgi:hypothetical protein